MHDLGCPPSTSVDGTCLTCIHSTYLLVYSANTQLRYIVVIGSPIEGVSMARLKFSCGINYAILCKLDQSFHVV